MLVEICLVHLAAMASPGPNVLLVVHTALARSRRAGLWAAAGIASGAFAWSASVALGLGLVFAGSAAAHDVVRILGGLYLLVLGVHTARAAGPPPHRDGDGAAGPADSDLRAWVRGGATNLSNPKAAVFYLSIFGTMLPAHASFGLRSTAVGLIFVNALLWHALLALAFSTEAPRAGYLRRRRLIDRVAGGVMATFGTLFLTGAR